MIQVQSYNFFHIYPSFFPLLSTFIRSFVWHLMYVSRTKNQFESIYVYKNAIFVEPMESLVSRASTTTTSMSAAKTETTL